MSRVEPACRLAGVELGGTKCLVTLGNGPDRIDEQLMVPTTTPDATLAAIADILSRWTYDALGIAAFGPIGVDPARGDYGVVLATNKPGWPGAPVLEQLSAVRLVPVAVDTDVNGAALAEMRWGCAKGLDDFAYVTVGTGVGVGLVVRGRTTGGIGHSEIGHLRIPRPAGDNFESVCRYHPDCVEGLASGSALRARLNGRAVEDVGPDDPLWTPIVEALAAMCHAIVVTTGPRRIAIGGGVAVRQPHLLPRIDTALRASLAGYMPLPPVPYIVAPALGAMAGPLGSIAVAATALSRVPA
jgi:fructokinase